jgi:hypothetical protein
MGWCNQKKNSEGKGIYLNRNTGEVFQGEWVDGLMHEGLLTQVDGSQYKVTYDYVTDISNNLHFYQ